MTIEITDITDPSFLRLEDDETKQAYVNKGLAWFSALCTEYKIDEASIPESIPRTPKEIAVACTMISFLRDYVGSDFREIREGFSVDVYASKLAIWQNNLDGLLKSFTPTMCGYEPDEDDGGVTSTSGFEYYRG